MKLAWNATVKKVLAAALYVVGASGVLFVGYKAYKLPGSEISYMALYAIGMVLVVVAAVLWTKPEASGEGQEEPTEASGER